MCLCETARQPARGPDLVLSPVRWSVVLHWYFGDVSRMAVAFWCGAVFFPRFSVDGRSQREFGGGFLRVYVGGRRAPYCCLSFWLCSLFFLYVVFHDYLLIFIPSLSMKWAPSCAGSFKFFLCRYLGCYICEQLYSQSLGFQCQSILVSFVPSFFLFHYYNYQC